MSYSKVFIFLFFTFLAFGQFTVRTGTDNPFDSIDTNGGRSSPFFADVDGDDDLDLLLGEGEGTLRYYRNDEGVFNRQMGADNPFDNIEDVGFFARPTLVDVDRDNDLDLVIGALNGDFHYYRNDGGVYNRRTGSNSPFTDLGGLHDFPNPFFIDLDNDNDLDLVVGSGSAGNSSVNYYRNDGGVYNRRTGNNNPFNGINLSLGYAPSFIDLDGDNDLDLILGRLDGTLDYYRNDGGVYNRRTGSNNPFDGIDVGSYSHPVFADIDGDGDVDLVVGEEGGDLNYYTTNSPATLNTTDLRDALNTLGDERVLDLGSITINDVDSDSSLTGLLIFATTYGTITLDPISATPEIDGEYSVSLLSNQDFDDLVSDASDSITFTTADGTVLTLNINIVFFTDFAVLLSSEIFTYDDTAADLQALEGTSTVINSTGTTIYGIVNEADAVVQTLAGDYGTLTINVITGVYIYDPNDEVIYALKNDASEMFTISAIDETSSPSTQILRIMITAIDNPATVDTTNLNKAVNTVADDDTIDLGTIIINDVDGENNLTEPLTFVTSYGNVTFTAVSGNPETDGEYSLSLASNQVFDELTTATSVDLTLVTADGTNLALTLNLVVNDLTLSSRTFTYNDDLPIMTQQGIATAINFQGTIIYGIVNEADAVVQTLAGDYGMLTINLITGAYSYEPNSESILALTSDASEMFTISVIGEGNVQINQTLTIMITAIDDSARTRPPFQFFVGNSNLDDGVLDLGMITILDIDSDSNLIGDLTFVTPYGDITLTPIGTPEEDGEYRVSIDTNDAFDSITSTEDTEQLSLTTADGTSLNLEIGFGIFSVSTTIPNFVYNDASETFLTFPNSLSVVGAIGDVTVGLLNDADEEVTVLETTYGTLRQTGGVAYEFVPNAEAIRGLSADASEFVTFFARDERLAMVTTEIGIMITAIDDVATISTNLNDAVNTVEEDGTLDLGTVTISDIDSDNNLQVLEFMTMYGTLTLTETGTATEDGEYSLTLSSNADFESLSTSESLDITLTSADGTTFDITLTFINNPYSSSLDISTFTYTDASADFIAQSGMVTVTDEMGTVSYGIVNASNDVVLILVGSLGTLTVDENTGSYTFTPNAEAIRGLSSDISEEFTISATDQRPLRATNILTIMVTAIDDVATISTNLNDAVNTVEDDGILDLGTVTISDIDSDNNLQVLEFMTMYGTLTLTETGTATEDGEYSLTLSSNADFESLSTSESLDITLTSADGTTFDVTLTFINDPYSSSLDISTFTYTDASADFIAQSGMVTVTDEVGTVSYGIVNASNDVVLILVGALGTLTVDENTGSYTFTPNAEAIRGLSSDISEEFTISATDQRPLRATNILTIMVTAIDDSATLDVTGVNDAVNTVEDDGTLDLGTVTISDIDSDNNLQVLEFMTTYGTLTLTETGTATEDGEYSLSLASNDDFDTLEASVSEDITLMTADGTTFDITLTFRVDNYSLSLDMPTFTYVDTIANDDFNSQSATATANHAQGVVSYGIIDSGAVVTSLLGNYGTLIINASSGEYSYEPNDEAINLQSSNVSEMFTISVVDERNIRLTQLLTIMITGIDDPATLSSSLNEAVNTLADEDIVDLGSIIISDIDSARNLTNLTLSTSYGMVTFTPVAGTTATDDGAYTLSLASNDDFDALSTIEEETITLMTADGTELELVLTFRSIYNLTLSTPMFSYSDSEADPQVQSGTVTVVGSFGTVTYGVVNTSNDVVLTLAGAYGTLTVDMDSGAYSYDPDDAVIAALTANASEEFNLSAIDTGNGNLQVLRPLTISISAIDDPATLSSSLNDAVNTLADEDVIDLGTVTISDVDSARNLTNLTLSTSYGNVTFTPVDGTTATDDGEYTLSLASNDDFDALINPANEDITLTTADGTEFILTLNFQVDSYDFTLSAPTFNYNDNEADPQAQSGTVTVTDEVGTVSYGIVNASNDVVLILVGSLGTLTVDENTGSYTFTPNAEAIRGLSSDSSEEFTISATDQRPLRVTNILTIMVTAIDDVATISTNLNDAVNTVEDDGTLDLGTVTISDIDSDNNLQVLEFMTMYGTLTLTETGTATEDGEYSLTLSSNADFESLSTSESLDITLTSADGTTFDITLTFRVDNYSLSLDTPTFTYVDTIANDDFNSQSGTATANHAEGVVSYGIIDSGSVVTSLLGNYGTLIINASSGVYSYDPDDEAINLLSSNISEMFTISVEDERNIRLTQLLTIMITGIDDPATLSSNLNEAINTLEDDGEVDLGTITISDIDSARNLTDLTLSTSYGMVTFTPVAGTTATDDGEYTLSLASNDDFDLLSTIEEETITLMTADGTELDLTLIFRNIYNLTLSMPIFSYSDSEADPQVQSGTVMVNGSVGTITYGVVNASNDVVLTLAGAYGILTVDEATGAYSYDPDDEAILALMANASEVFSFSAIDAGNGNLQVLRTLTISISAIDDSATLSSSLNDAVNTLADEGVIDLGTVTISDIDSARNLVSLIIPTPYGNVTFTPVEGTTATDDGEYTLSLASNDDFDALINPVNEDITLTTADGTEFILTLNFQVDSYDFTLSETLFSYSDSEVDPQAQSGTVTVVDPQGAVTYGIVNTSDDVVLTLAGAYGILTVDEATGAYSYDPDDEAIANLAVDVSEEFSLSVTDERSLQLQRTLTIAITAIDDPATISSDLNRAVNTLADGGEIDLGTVTISDIDSARNLVSLIFSTAYGDVTFMASGTPAEDGAYSLSLAPNADFEDLTANMDDVITLTTADGTEFELNLRFGVGNVFESIEVDEISKEDTRTVVDVLVELVRNNNNQEEVETINNHIEDLAAAADNNSNDPSVEAALDSLVPDNVPTLSSAVESTLNNITSSLTEHSLSFTEIGIVAVRGPQDRNSQVDSESKFNYILSFNNGSRDGGSNALGYGYNGQTLGIGYDRKFSDVFLGLGLSYSDVSIDNNNNEGSSSIDTILLSVYGNYHKDEQTINVTFSLGNSSVSSLRQGLFSSVGSSTSAFSYDLSVLYGWTFDKYGLKLTPTAGFRYNASSFGDIVEKGTGGTTSSGASYDSFYVTIGGIVSKSLVSNVYHHKFSILGNLSLNLLDVDRDVTSRFNAGNDSFEVSGIDESVATLNLGFSWQLTIAELSLELGYKLRFNSVSTANQFSLQIKELF